MVERNVKAISVNAFPLEKKATIVSRICAGVDQKNASMMPRAAPTCQTRDDADQDAELDRRARTQAGQSR